MHWNLKIIKDLCLHSNSPALCRHKTVLSRRREDGCNLSLCHLQYPCRCCTLYFPPFLLRNGAVHVPRKMPGHTGLRKLVQGARRVPQGREVPAPAPLLLLLHVARSRGIHVSRELLSVLVVKSIACDGLSSVCCVLGADI